MIQVGNGEVPMRDMGFLASEGHFTIPHQDQTPSGILSLHSNYYEFIPEEALDAPDPPVLSSHELEPGVDYAVLLTTAGGLYRYDIHDIVQVTAYFNYINRIADGLGVDLEPEMEPDEQDAIGFWASARAHPDF